GRGCAANGEREAEKETSGQGDGRELSGGEDAQRDASAGPRSSASWRARRCGGGGKFLRNGSAVAPSRISTERFEPGKSDFCHRGGGRGHRASPSIPME